MTFLNTIYNRASQTGLAAAAAAHLSPKHKPTKTPDHTNPPTPLELDENPVESSTTPSIPTSTSHSAIATADEPISIAIIDPPSSVAEPIIDPTSIIEQPVEEILIEQPVETAPVVLAEEVAAPVEAQKVEEAPVVAAPEPETVAESTTVEPLKDEVNKQPTTTHAEQGNLHTPAETATTVDGTPAEVPAEETSAAAAPETPAKEEKKETTKEKVEKTKAEGKGFFAKLFGNKDKSPKKEKKVKTPKTEKTEEAATAPAPAVEESAAPAPAPEAETEVKAEEVKPEVTGVAAVNETPAEVATIAEASTSTAPVAEPVTTEARVETTTPSAEAKADEPIVAKDDAKAAKAHRRLSTRFTSFVKGIGKKDHPSSPIKDEKAKEVSTSTEESAAPVVSDEAPKIEEPAAQAPIELDEKKPVSAAPPAAPVVATTA